MANCDLGPLKSQGLPASKNNHGQPNISRSNLKRSVGITSHVTEKDCETSLLKAHLISDRNIPLMTETIHKPVTLKDINQGNLSVENPTVSIESVSKVNFSQTGPHLELPISKTSAQESPAVSNEEDHVKQRTSLGSSRGSQGRRASPVTENVADSTLNGGSPPQNKSGSLPVLHACQVCMDRATGFHYGVWSCEGCKAFFKRSLQASADELQYICPGNQNCTIDKQRRKCCQACRLRKCLEVGMKKTGTFGDNSWISERGRNAKRKRGKDSSIPKPPAICRVSESKQLKTANAIITMLLDIEPADLLAGIGGERLTEIQLAKLVLNLADNRLHSIINWAKNLPGYRELTISDQIHLLESCWLEIFILDCAFKSMSFDGDRLVIAPDLILDRETFNRTQIGEICDLVVKLAARLKDLKLSKEEFICLKALTVLNSEMRKLESHKKIEEIQVQYIDALSDAIHNSDSQDVQRIGKLLMLLPFIRQASVEGIALLFELKNNGGISEFLKHENKQEH